MNILAPVLENARVSYDKNPARSAHLKIPDSVSGPLIPADGWKWFRIVNESPAGMSHPPRESPAALHISGSDPDPVSKREILFLKRESPWKPDPAMVSEPREINS